MTHTLISSSPLVDKRLTRMLRALLPGVLAVLLTACAGLGSQPDPSEYLDAAEYDRLKQVSTQPGIRIYRYQAPDFRRSDFKTVMVDPIVLYQSAEKDLGKNGISEEAIYRIRNSMDITMRQLVRKQFGISYKPGQRVARLSTAITGVLLDGDTFKPRRLVPISTVLKTAGTGSSINGSKPYLMVEAKLLNSTTGKLMGEGVYLISSEQFRREVDSPEKFQLLANQWVRGAISVASGLR
jgi:hypothetical protein